MLVSLCLAFSHGYAFMRGKAWERRSQANAIVELNTKLVTLRENDAKEEIEFEKRLAAAREDWAKNIPVSKPGEPTACALDEGSIRRIRAIVKSAQVTP